MVESMKGGKDGVDTPLHAPLFPRLHINDASEKGGPRPPPRNKMALCEKYNVPSQLATKARSGSVSQSSSSYVASPKQEQLCTPNSLQGYHSYYPGGVNLKNPPAITQHRMSGPSSFRDPRLSDNTVMTASECSSSELPDYHLNRSREEKNFRISPFFQSGNIPLSFGKEKPSNPRSGSSAKLSNTSLTKPPNQNLDYHSESPLLISPKRDRISVDMAMSERVARKRSFSVIDDSPPVIEDNNETCKSETIKECCDRNAEQMRVGNDEKSEESSDTSVAESLPTLDLTPDDVVGAIGQKLFWKARKTIVNQQRLFAVQIFELHRLIKVQKLIAESPEVLCANLKKPPIKFPPINNLLYVTPLDPSPVTTDKLIKPITNAIEKQASPKPPPTLPPIPSFDTAKLTPLYFHSPPGNQWLIPVRSPSEGLIYKPYTGHYPPPGGIMAPIFGNCGPISLSPKTGTDLVAPSYFPPFAIPLMNTSSPNLQVGSFTEPDKHVSFEANFPNIPSMSSQWSELASECATSRFKRDALSLFPTTPSVEAQKDQGQKVQVIKVVPHNPKAAPESVARIFQSIQEERRTM